LDSLNRSQRAALESHANLVVVPIPTIERVGGGGVRCMLAEIHLPKRAGSLSRDPVATGSVQS
jgi:hypothetical protein